MSIRWPIIQIECYSEVHALNTHLPTTENKLTGAMLTIGRIQNFVKHVNNMYDVIVWVTDMTSGITKTKGDIPNIA